MTACPSNDVSEIQRPFPFVGTLVAPRNSVNSGRNASVLWLWSANRTLQKRIRTRAKVIRALKNSLVFRCRCDSSEPTPT
jgi:hypothetical protein